MAQRSGRSDADPLICFCNEVRRSEIVAAIRAGAGTLASIYDATWAGCGACGGSCQPDVAALLAEQQLGLDEKRQGKPATGDDGTRQ